MPGGVDGLKAMVAAFHTEGVKVLLPYNPVREVAIHPSPARLRVSQGTYTSPYHDVTLLSEQELRLHRSDFG